MQSNKISENATYTIAKVIGFTLVFGITIVMFGEFYVSDNLIVRDNSIETAKNIAAHQTQFRMWIICNLLYITNNIVLLSALYLMLKNKSHGLALIAAVFKFIYVLMWVLMVLTMLNVLRLLNDNSYLQVFDVERLHTLVMLNISSTTDNYYVGLPFWALSSTIFSYLWYKSKYIPRVLAIFGMLASAWCVICAFAFIAIPNFEKIVNAWWYDTAMAIIFDLALGFWLLFKGVKK